MAHGLIKIRRDTSANWTDANPVLADGELGYNKTTNRIKVGDGTTAYNSLSPLTATAVIDSADVTTALGFTPYDAANPSGYVTSAALTWGNVSGKPTTFTPSSHTHVIGDVTGLQTALDGKQPAGAYLTTVSWTDVTGKPTTFTPAAHTHVIADVTGLQAALDLKLDDSQAGTFGLTLLGAANVAAAKTSLAYVKADVGLGNVDNTSDAAKPISTATQTALDAKQATIAAGTTGQYWRGDKTWQTLDKSAVGLANVDNTTDANKPISTATQTALNGKANSSHTHPSTDITDFQEAVEDRIGASILNGSNVTVTYDDTTGKTTIAATGGSGSGPVRTLYRLSAAAHSNSTVTPSTIGNASADTDWTHTMVTGKVYRINIWANYQTAAATTGGRMNLLGAGGLAGNVQGMMWGGIVQAAAASTLEVPIFSFANGTGAFLLTTGVNPINSPHVWGAEFVFVCTTGGTLSLQWASEVAASAAQLNIGATMLVEELN